METNSINKLKSNKIIKLLREKSGFTLIEVLVSMAILSTIFMVSSEAFYYTETQAQESDNFSLLQGLLQNTLSTIKQAGDFADCAVNGNLTNYNDPCGVSINACSTFNQVSDSHSQDSNQITFFKHNGTSDYYWKFCYANPNNNYCQQSLGYNSILESTNYGNAGSTINFGGKVNNTYNYNISALKFNLICPTETVNGVSTTLLNGISRPYLTFEIDGQLINVNNGKIFGPIQFYGSANFQNSLL